VKDIDKKAREKVRDRFKDRILRALAAANMCVVMREGLYWLAIRPRLNKILGL